MSTKFNIYYASSPNGPWTLANPTPIDRNPLGNEYTITGLQHGVLYYIRIIGGILDVSNNFIPISSQPIGPKTAGAGFNETPSSVAIRTWLPEIDASAVLAQRFNVFPLVTVSSYQSHQFDISFPIQLVQYTSNISTASNGSVTATFSQAPTDGNCIVILATQWDQFSQLSNPLSSASVAPSGGIVVTTATRSSGSRTMSKMWYIPNASSLGTTVSVSSIGSASTVYTGVIAIELSNIALSSPLDKFANAGGSGSYLITGTTAVTTQADEVWVGGGGGLNSGFTGVLGNGFTEVTEITQNSFAMVMGYNVVSAVGTASTNKQQNSSTNYAGVIGTFKHK